MKKLIQGVLIITLLFCCSTNDDIVVLPYDVNADPDQDGIINLHEDLNQDGDPKNDDTDGDGKANYRDPDDDNDGILTILEDVNGNGNPLDDDTDFDGTADYLDAHQFSDWINGEWKLIEARCYQRDYTMEEEILLQNETQMTYSLIPSIPNYTIHDLEFVFEGKIIIDFPRYQFHRRYYDENGTLLNERITNHQFNQNSNDEEGVYSGVFHFKYIPEPSNTPYTFENGKSFLNNLDTLKFYKNIEYNEISNKFIFVRN